MNKIINTNCNTIKVLEENIDKKISDIACSNIFTNMSPRTRGIKERINKWNLTKIKSFYTAEESSIKMKREPSVWENIFTNNDSDKGLIFKIYEELTLLYSRNTNNPIKNWQRTWTDISPRGTYRGPIGIWNNTQHH